LTLFLLTQLYDPLSCHTVEVNEAMKICIISNSHLSNDVRLYYKLGISLAKQHEVYVITTSGVVNDIHNPFQVVVDSESPWRALRIIAQKVNQIKPELLICVEPLTLLVAWRLKKKLGLRVIFDVHEFFAYSFSERFIWPIRFPFYLAYQTGLKILIRIADGIWTVNREVGKQLLGKSVDHKAVVLPNYPVKNVWDYVCDVPGALEQVCQMDFDLIYIGGLTKDRGIFKLLKLASLLKHDFPMLKILVLGKFFSPETEKQFNQSINSYNLNAVIYYHEWIPAEKIGLLLKRCRFGLWLFNPRNRRMKLTTPLKVLEYLAAGLPVITVKTPLMKALIEHNGLGICSGFQARAIAKATAKMLRLSNGEYEDMHRKCLEIAETRFNWEALEPQLFQSLNQVMAK